MPAPPPIIIPETPSDSSSDLSSAIASDGVTTAPLRCTHPLQAFRALVAVYLDTVGSQIVLIFDDRTWDYMETPLRERPITGTDPVVTGTELRAILDANPTYTVIESTGEPWGWSGGTFTQTPTIDVELDPLTAYLPAPLESALPTIIPI